MTELKETKLPMQSIYTTQPDVDLAHKNYDLAVPAFSNSNQADRTFKKLQNVSSRENSTLLANASARSKVGPLREHLAPHLLPGEMIRWQLAVTLAGGFIALFVYSYATNKKIF